MKLTCWNLFSGVHGFKQVDRKVHHVRLPRELVLGRLDILGWEDSRLGEIREERESQMSVQVRNYLLREIPFGHGCKRFFLRSGGNPLGCDGCPAIQVFKKNQSQRLPDMEGDRWVINRDVKMTRVHK